MLLLFQRRASGVVGVSCFGEVADDRQERADLNTGRELDCLGWRYTHSQCKAASQNAQCRQSGAANARIKGVRPSQPFEQQNSPTPPRLPASHMSPSTANPPNQTALYQIRATPHPAQCPLLSHSPKFLYPISRRRARDPSSLLHIKLKHQPFIFTLHLLPMSRLRGK